MAISNPVDLKAPATTPSETNQEPRPWTHGWRHDLRGISIIVQRDFVRFKGEPVRVIASLVSPMLFLLVIGSGIGSIATLGTGVNLRQVLFPGSLIMAVLFTSIFSAGTIIWDREFGFLRQLMVSPVSSWTIVAGKCLAGALLGCFQGVFILAGAGLANIPYDPALIGAVLAEMFLTALALSAFGVMLAVRLKQTSSFGALVQVTAMPMLALSGGMFPLAGLPSWLQFLTRINPLTYAVDPIRITIFQHLDLPPAARDRLLPHVSWNGWPVPIWLELIIVTTMTVTFLTIAVRKIRTVD